MLKRYGITNDPPRQRIELKQEYSGFSNFRVERRFPNQEEAQEWESKQSGIPHPGWPKIDGPFYGYSHCFTKKKRWIFMSCRVGITTDPEKRKQYWQGLHPHLRNWKIIASNLSYLDAQRKETEYAKRCSCESHSGRPGNRGKYLVSLSV